MDGGMLLAGWNRPPLRSLIHHRQGRRRYPETLARRMMEAGNSLYLFREYLNSPTRTLKTHKRIQKHMNIVVNGQDLTCSEGLTVHGLLVELELKPDAIVVERNAEILPRSAYATTMVSDGDSLEFIHFVGGG
jgi:sulfur carrier protein